MKVNELRIGNRILIYGVVCTVDARTIFDFDTDGRKKEGVKLTQDILIEAGFEDLNFGWPVGYKRALSKDVFLIPETGTGEWSVLLNRSYIPRKTIRFLHELQNLWFAVYGEELFM